VVKGFTDKLMKNFDVLNLRIRMPISSKLNDRNFINKITKYQFICSIPNSMTVLDDFFPIFTDLMIRKKTGTYNCTNPGVITHNQILEMYKQIINPSFTWKNMTLEEQSKILKSDRSNNYLDTTKIQKEFPKLKGIHDSVIIILNKMALL
jgi:3,5-epimerase/4-reductase